MSFRTLTVAAVSAAVLAVGAGAAVAQAAKFEGTVVAKNKAARTFKLKREQNRGTVLIKVNKNTVYQRLAGFRAIKVGMKRVSAVAHRNANGRWVATLVERSGKAGGAGGGGNDGPNHT